MEDKGLVKRKSKKFKILLAVFITLGIVVSFFAGFFIKGLTLGNNANTLSWVINTIDREGCIFDEETGEVRSLTAEDYADAIVSKLLDSYSAFYTSKEYSDVLATSKGNNYGVGLSFLRNVDDLTVYSVTWNSPADKANVMAGDKIVAGRTSDGTTTTFTKNNEILNFLSERKENEEFTLVITRYGVFENREFTLSRRAFITSYVTYSDNTERGVFRSEGSQTPVFTKLDEPNTSLDNDTAIIQLSLFESLATNQLKEALSYMSQKNKTKLILDLRDNGGGYMDVLCNIASYLTYGDGGKFLVAVAKDKNGNSSYFNSIGDNFNRNIKSVVVIANEYTASASECLIGAMLHYGKAFDQSKLVIVNDTLSESGIAYTYGKGIMQTTFTKPISGEALKLTTAYIYQPDGSTCIHGKGLTASAENSFTDDISALNRAIQII